MTEGIDELALTTGVIYVLRDDHAGLTVVHPDDADPAVTYGHDLPIGGAEWILRIDNGPLVTRERDLGGVTVAALTAAIRLRRCCSRSDDNERVIDRIYTVPTDDSLNRDYLPELNDYFLEVTDDELTVVISETYERWPGVTATEYAHALRPVAANYGFENLDVQFGDEGGTPFEETFSAINTGDAAQDKYWQDEAESTVKGLVHMVEVRLTAVDSDLVDKLLTAGRGMTAFLRARRGGVLAATTIADLLRAGHTQALLGQEESAFLEIKSARYGIDLPGKAGTSQKIELAQDVARFANGDQDAILIIGIKEVNRGTGQPSKLGKLNPFPLPDFQIEQYRNVLDQYVVPAITGLTIETVDVGGGVGLGFILLPRQPAEMQPYLVHGAIIGDKTEGAFISIVQRRGEGSITIKASEIHGYLVAGRAFLRMQQRKD